MGSRIQDALMNQINKLMFTLINLHLHCCAALCRFFWSIYHATRLLSGSHTRGSSPSRHQWFAGVSCNPSTGNCRDAPRQLLQSTDTNTVFPNPLFLSCCPRHGIFHVIIVQAPEQHRILYSEAVERTQPGGDKTEISLSAIRENGEKYEGSTGRTSESFLLLPPPWQRVGGSGSSAELFSSLPMSSPFLVALEKERCPLQPGRPGSSLLCLSLGQVLFPGPSQNIIFKITQPNSSLIQPNFIND